MELLCHAEIRRYTQKVFGKRYFFILLFHFCVFLRFLRDLNIIRVREDGWWKMEEVSAPSQVFAFTYWVISVIRPLTKLRRPLTELRRPLTIVRRPLTASKKWLEEFVKGVIPSTLRIASPKPFTVSYCRATYYNAGEGFPDWRIMIRKREEHSSDTQNEWPTHGTECPPANPDKWVPGGASEWFGGFYSIQSS